MVVITPTISDFRYGRRLFQKLDTYQHPIRDAGGNPAVIKLHGGGGVVGAKEDTWTGGTNTNFAEYLHTTRNAASDLHFDTIAVETRQKIFTTPQFRGDQAYFPETIIDVKRAIIAIKARAAELGIDPTKLFLMGESHGGWKTLMCMCTAPLVGAGGGAPEQLRRLDQTNYDSIVRGYISQSGMIDVRRTGNVDQIHYASLGAWFGTRDDAANQTGAFPNDTGVEWNAVPAQLKAAASPLAYVEAGATRFFRPLYITGATSGNHTHPYADPAGPTGPDGGPNIHDGQQGLDLYNAMKARGLSATDGRYAQGSWDTFGSAAATAVSLGVYNFMASVLAGPIYSA